MHKLLLSTVACIISPSLQAQSNLVRNPSFETTNTCAIGAYWGIDTLWFDDPAAYRTAQYWISPNNESPDYFNSCQTDGIAYSVPLNGRGYQVPHTGNAYMCIGTYKVTPGAILGGQFREYIQTRITKALEPGALYCGQFYMSLTYSAYNYNVVAIGNMSMALTQKQPLNDSPSQIIAPASQTTIFLNPQIKQHPPISRDTVSWQLVQGVFKAQGGEEWLTIGNFNTLANTDTLIVLLNTPPGFAPSYQAHYYIDDVSLEKVSDPIFTAHDTAVCQLPATISAREGFDEYHWSTGETTQSIQVNTPGKYWVKVKLGECGEVSDTIKVAAINHVSLHVRDTVVCPALLPVTLVASTGLSQYSWSDGQDGASASFAVAGIYTVAAVSACGLVRDTFSIQVQEVPDFDLGDPVDLCQDEQNVPIELKPSVALPNYTWSTGANNPAIVVGEPGQYWLRSANICGEKSDTINITGCAAQIYIPNVFSPNDDGENDYFKVFGRSISNVTISIFDRWGALLYQENNDDPIGWNGIYNGNPLSSGVFVYLVTYQMEGSTAIQRRSGSVLLVR